MSWDSTFGGHEAARRVSADSHVVEPVELFAAVAKKLGREAPNLVHTDDRGWTLETNLGHTFQPGAFGTAGTEPQTPEYVAQERSGYARASLTDVDKRLAEMDRDGVAAEVLFPSMLGSFISGRKAGAEITEALCRSYNDWVAEYCRASPRRLFPIACIAVRNLHAAVAEMKRARTLGHVGIVLPSGSPEYRPYGDGEYDALWAVAQDLGLPVAFHAAHGSDLAMRAESFARHGFRYTLRHITAEITVSDLILGGVCERFPNLRFVLAEYGVGWIAHFLAASDWRQARRRGSGLPLRFSDYWRRNFRATFEDDEIGVRLRDEIGVGSLLWANDYPHGDSIWPHSTSILDRILAGCPPEERHAMTVQNAVDLFRLPIDVPA
jgi:predicted TIM-barrel fold metal-dependent hydrolase